MSDFRTKLRLLIPRLASNADGEVLATVAAIRRVLAAEGFDLHDLAAELTGGSAEPTPAELARSCIACGVPWRSHELDFLHDVTRFGWGWNALSEKQERWLRNLYQRAMCTREAAA